MGLVARWLGTRGPDDGSVPVSAWELRRRLLALQRPDAPWVIRPGDPERVDVIAEWTAHLGSTTYRLVVLIALDERRHEARTLDTWSESGGPGGGRSGRGNIRRRASSGTIERDGFRLRFVHEESFDSRRLKEPLRDTVTASGWTWQGRLRHP